MSRTSAADRVAFVTQIGHDSTIHVGLRPQARVTYAVEWRRGTGRRVLAVSEFYHLPRIKLAYARAGLDVFTVPARPQNWRRAWDLRSIFREVPAFWVYHLRATASR